LLSYQDHGELKTVDEILQGFLIGKRVTMDVTVREQPATYPSRWSLHVEKIDVATHVDTELDRFHRAGLTQDLGQVFATLGRLEIQLAGDAAPVPP